MQIYRKVLRYLNWHVIDHNKRHFVTLILLRLLYFALIVVFAKELMPVFVEFVLGEHGRGTV